MEKTRRPVRPGDVSRAVAARQLKFLMWKYNGVCQYCFKKIPAGLQTREHIKRLIDGGTSDKDNLTLACGPCNFAADVRAYFIKLVTSGIQECIQRQVRGLPVVPPATNNTKAIAPAWPALVRTGIFGTIRRQEIGVKLVAAPPPSVECSSVVTKKLRK